MRSLSEIPHFTVRNKHGVCTLYIGNQSLKLNLGPFQVGLLSPLRPMKDCSEVGRGVHPYASF